MRVISLYSFKGGVGRTSLALNLAYQLALQAKFVVLADWDLHAPGLSLMEDLAMPEGPFPRKGILDFLWSALAPLGSSERSNADIIDPLLLAQSTLLAARSRPDNRSFGDIFFIPAGRFGSGDQRDYPESVRKLHLPDLVTWRARLPGNDAEQSVLRFFCERIAAARSEAFGKDYPPDFLLLDSRTGITEIGDLLLGNGVDHYVVLFGLNEQNQAGMEMIVRGAQERVRPGGLPDALSLIASPVPVGEEDLLRERLAALNARLGRLARRLDDGKAEPLPAVLRIPYHPRLALREEIIVERYPESALAQTYRDIATHVLRQERTLESAEASTRVQVLADVPGVSGAPVMVNGAVSALLRSWQAPRHWMDPPPWNWADPSLGCEQLVPGVSPELSRPLLDGLAWSNSLFGQEKLRVLAFAATLPGPRIARLTEPFLRERESKMSAWQYNWTGVEWAHARAATDWVEVLGRLRLVEVDGVWRSVGADAADRVLPAGFASPRLIYLIAGELVERGSFRAATPLIVRVLASDALAPVAARAKEAELRLRSLDLGAVDEPRFRAAFPEDAMVAFRSVLDRHAEGAVSIADAMAATRRVHWKAESSSLGAQIWSLAGLDAKLWLRFANEYFDLEDLASAERAARQALTQEPGLVHAWVLLARSLAQDTSRFQEARAALHRAEQLATNASELHAIAGTLAEDFGEYDKALQLFEKVVSGEEPNFSNELEFAEIAVAAHARDVARDALARARILLEGPLRPHLDPDDAAQGYSSVFYVVDLALAMLENDPVHIETTSRLLLEAVAAQGTYPSWRFNALVSGLKDLPDRDKRLLESATALVHLGDAAAFRIALAKWSQAPRSPARL